MPPLPQTDTAIRRLAVIAGTWKSGKERLQTAYFDEKTPGLSLIVSTKTKSWSLTYTKPGGKRKRIALGRYPAVGLAAARDRAQGVFASLHDDVDPAAKRKARRASLTVAEAGAKYVEFYASKKSTGRFDKSLFEVNKKTGKKGDVLAEIGEKKLIDVSRRDVQAVLRRVLDRGAGVMANRTLEVVRKFLGWSVEQGWIDTNPAVGISKPTAERPRSRTLSDAELRTLWQALDENVSRQARACFKLLLLTGQREMEVVRIRWSEIDFGRGIWTLPAYDPGRSKRRSAPHIVPLTPTALEVLNSLQKVDAEAPIESGGRLAGMPAQAFEDYVFRGRHRNGSPAAPTRGIVAMAKEALDGEHLKFAEPWRIHDLRRTVRTGLSQLSVQPHIAELVIGHSIGGLVKVYDRYDYLAEKREALTRWADHLLTIVGERPRGENVVPINVAAD